MATALSALVVSLGLDGAHFFSGLSKAEFEAKKSIQNISRSFDQLKGIAAAVGVGIGANAFKDMILGAFDAQEHLANLGKRAGITGAELSSLSAAARFTHTSLDDVAGMSAKLSKALLDFGKEGSKSTVVLTALGVSAKDVPGLLAKPADAVLALAKLLDQLPEGGTKAAAQLLILGKAGGTTSAFLSQLATQTALVKTRTDEEIEAARHFNDRLTEMGIKSDELKTKFANALLPTLDALLTAFGTLTSGAGGAAATLERLKNDGDIQEWARDAAIAVGTLAESLVVVGRLGRAVTGSFRVVAADIEAELARTNAPSQKPFGSLGFSPEEAAKGEADYIAASKRAIKVKEDADQNYADLWEKNGTFITDAIKKSFEMQDRATQAGVDALANSDRNDRLNTTNNAKAADAAKKAADAKAKAVQAALNAANAATTAGDDPARRILEGQIKALEASIARERDVLNAHQDYLRDYYQDGRLSLTQFYDQLQAARDANLQSTLATLNKEIELAEEQKRKAVKATDRAGFQNQADSARERQTTLTLQAQFAEEALARDRARATEQYGFQLNEINAKMLELAGNTAAAAAIRFDDQNAVFNRGLQASGNTGAIAQQQALKDAAVAQSALNDQTRQFNVILNGVGIAQERIALAAQTGAIGEFEALIKTSAAATAQIPKLTAIADAMEIIANKAKDLNADGSINIVKLEQLQAVDQLRLGIEKLAAQSDLLAKKFNDIGASALSDAIQSVVNGEKSLKQAALDFSKSISQSITKAITDNITQQAFGKGGIFSGFGDTISKMLGGGANDAAGAASSAAAATALTGSATGLATAGVSLTGAGLALDTAAAATAAAAAALTAAAAVMVTSAAASAIGSSVGKIAGAFGGGQGGLAYAASGTDFARGGPTMVGERGPEIVNLPRGARVTANDEVFGKRGSSINMPITINTGGQPMTPRSQRNMARELGMAVNRELRRG